MNRPQALIFILFLIIQLNYVYSVCTKRNVATAINVDVGNIDLFCNPDEWFHGRINNHIRLKIFVDAMVSLIMMFIAMLREKLKLF